MIMEESREMLHDKDIPMHIWDEAWDEAARIVVYVQNHTLHRVLENKAPEEFFSSKKPEVSHLKLFGCPVYVHTHSKRKEDKIRSFRKEGYICGR